MRFRHLDPEPVLTYLRGTKPPILVREWERDRSPGGLAGMLRMARPQAAGAAKPAGVDEVEFIARRHPPSGIAVVLRYYFHVGSTSAAPVLPLIEAVDHVERNGVGGEVLLAGHPDGGLISVSRERLPFQQGDPITWWGP
jgi:hypothetical protein